MRARLVHVTAAMSLLAMAAMSPASATVDNVVTAKATAPAGPAGGVTGTASAKVDVQNSAPAVVVVRSWSFAPGGDVNGNGLVDTGDQIVYSYTVRNSGNVTLADVNVNDVHDGTGAPLAFVTPVSVTTDNGSAPAGTLNDSTDTGTADSDWDVLGPNDTVTFTSQPYTITIGDMAALTSADGTLDGTVTASGSYDPGTGPVTASASSPAPVPLHVIPSLQVSKVATPDVNVQAGTPVTYTYHVKNNGTVPITNVTLRDTHKGVLDALVPQFVTWITNTGSSNTGNTIDTLAPGDEAEFTATYTVTQQDVDTLQ
jgi:uncharacterized repeat protein (TIGR01451 family)